MRSRNEKDLSYFYPTSDGARECGHANVGCWVITTDEHVHVFATARRREAWACFTALPNPVGRWSFGGPNDLEDREALMTRA